MPTQQDVTTVTTTLTALKAAGSHLRLVLAEYETIKDLPERVGLCHNIAVAIMRDLHERGTANGWTWCQGKVDGGLDHSWVEYRGLGIDMGDDHRLRVRTMAVNPPFKIEGHAARCDSAQTVAWAEEREAAEQRALKDLWERLRAQILAVPTVPPVTYAAILVKVTSSPIPFPEPHDRQFNPPRLARNGATEPEASGVAHGFERVLKLNEKAAIAALFPNHAIEWSHTTWQETVLAND